MKVFPTCIFAPNGTDAYIDRRITSGGVSLSGQETIIGTDGGGRVCLEMNDFYLDEPTIARAWDAIDAYMDGGLRPMVVPFCDAVHQPAFYMEDVPHSDGTPFSDDTLYESGGTDVTIAVDAPLRATVIQVDIAALNGDPLGWFTIVHPTWGARAYKVAEILAQTPTSATLSIRPTLREAVTVGTAVDFANPRCTMRIEGDMRAPRNMGYAEGQALRFVEDMTGNYT